MRSIVAILVMLTAFACCPCRHLATGTTDSVRVEVRERIVEVRDTVEVYLPDERVENTTADTTSRLETSAAVSTASMRDGKLHHALWNKQQPIGVAVDMEFKVEDITKERITTIREVVEVPRNLTWWQQTQMRGFQLMLIVLCVWIGWKLFREKYFGLWM